MLEGRGREGKGGYEGGRSLQFVVIYLPNILKFEAISGDEELLKRERE